MTEFGGVFLEEILEQAHFPHNLIDVVMKCQTEVSIELLWNGTRAGSFKPSCGVRQGDPLSPYLFVLCIERLSHLIQDSMKDGSWTPISIGGVSLSHLLFADDLILFAEANEQQATTIKDCLNVFCTLSGEKVNFDKSSMIFSRKVQPSIRAAISECLSIPVVDGLCMYLGVPTACKRLTNDRYQFLLDRVTSRLQGWQSKILSMAGRTTLANLVLTSLPLYVMQSTLVPRSICDAMDSQIKKFVWGLTSDKHRMHLLSGDTISRPKKEGGLGLRSMKRLNVAVLAKRGWRMLQDPQMLWSRILGGKYCHGRVDIDIFQLVARSSQT